MPRYLVVAHQTASSPELRQTLREIRERQPEATFLLVVPATPVQHLPGWVEGEARAAAQTAGDRARELLLADGVPLEDVRVGDPNPVYAVEDETRDGGFDGIVVSTLPAGASRWLKLDPVSRLQRHLSIPVVHVVGSAEA